MDVGERPARRVDREGLLMGGRSIHPCPVCGTDIHDDAETCGRLSCKYRERRSARIDGLWELVSHHLNGDPRPDDRARLEARFRAGAAEHGDDWTTWPDERFDAEVLQELDDVLLYRAMQRAARAIRGGAR